MKLRSWVVGRASFRFGAPDEGRFDLGHRLGSSEREVNQRTRKTWWKPGGYTSSPHPLALCLAATSGVMSAYRSAALVEKSKRCDGFPEDAGERCLPLLYP